MFSAEDQSLFNVNVTALLKDIKQKLQELKTADPKRYQEILTNPAAIENINKIKQTCDENEEFYSQSFYGAAALNRRLLLDERTALLLNPETILTALAMALEYPESKVSELVRRVPGSTRNTTIGDVLIHAFSNGIEVVKFMTNNDRNFNKAQYLQQKDNFEKFATSVVFSALSAAQRVGIDIKDEKYKFPPHNTQSLREKFEDISARIKTIKEQDQSEKLLAVPGYSPDEMRRQSVGGFLAICDIIKKERETNKRSELQRTLIDDDNIGVNMTLAEFVREFVNCDKAVLNGSVIHLFYDRAHLEALLEVDNKIFFIDPTTNTPKEYTFADIISAMIAEAEKSPTAEIAREQFYIRFKVTLDDLEQRFPEVKRAAPPAQLPKKLSATSSASLKLETDYKNRLQEIINVWHNTEIPFAEVEILLEKFVTDFLNKVQDSDRFTALLKECVFENLTTNAKHLTQDQCRSLADIMIEGQGSIGGYLATFQEKVMEISNAKASKESKAAAAAAAAAASPAAAFAASRSNSPMRLFDRDPPAGQSSDVSSPRVARP